MPTLLQRAKEKQPRKPSKRIYSKEEIELALAWVNDEINLTQVMQALSATGRAKGPGVNSAVYIFLARVLKQFILDAR